MMSKNLKTSLLMSLVAVTFLFVGWGIGVTLFRDAFVVCQYEDSIATYCIRHGKVSGNTGSLYIPSSNPGHEGIKINLENVHTNKQAIKEIEKQVQAGGGHVIAVHS